MQKYFSCFFSLFRAYILLFPYLTNSTTRVWFMFVPVCRCVVVHVVAKKTTAT
ncbi:hypothetical protein B0T20DRAFT_277423 [Sordaria brevicollis]|uniref:Uncharacterized protein n=1 Tax=Sordaria brevicollis TaxID=83679 RepID=A0AAE0PBD6_SORBR|nr:hypothetical protein B0T20DRAFT_277423 [Sordaria brevicollis]